MEILNDGEEEITKNFKTHHENNEYEKLEYCVWKMTEKEKTTFISSENS